MATAMLRSCSWIMSLAPVTERHLLVRGLESTPTCGLILQLTGNYEPPDCGFDTVRINLTVTSRGKQFDRLALMYLRDNEVFRTSTAEPTTNGIVWTYIKEMSQYNSLWRSPQKLIFDLGNIINEVYTGSFNATLKAHFSEGQNVKTADIVLPISAKRSASNSPSAFQLPTDNTTVMYEIPAAASRAIVSISACGQSEEEFWWSNVFSQDTRDFESTVGGLYGYTPFREVQLYIDGILAGLVWPFPIIFTGGVAPGFWRPVVGTDAFDLRQPEIDISPFLPMVQDGKQHSFEIRVTGLNVSADGKTTFANTVGSYWVVTGNIFIYLNDNSSDSKVTAARDKDGPMVDAPLPVFAVTRNLVRNETGGNDSLSYSVAVKRIFSVRSSLYSWSQTLSFSNHGLLNQQGYSQVNRQLTTGNNSITELGDAPISYSITFQYPLVVNATYGITSNGMTIDSWMMRGLDFETTGGLGISTYTLSSGPSHLHTRQSGTAQYKSVTGGSSSSWGDTTNVFESQMNGQPYHRSVHAVNGTVVSDTDPGGKVSASSPQDYGDTGRGSVRAIIGKGPGALIN
ncbi:Pc14g01410 [Penicillium rubens Wisconsin 54-1255]|uniref:Pc14g01410 protein n=1 Tax=Penicillium rubens (strain ATCC 28089 / DSM 1075 / NRRL 1951 / Wisconsin 54-1255) TaxID=500485 RepID=B6H5W9_PENRW|nr:Pc14g01410 [Penicillium rubens Wisconsin 54-1255]